MCLTSELNELLKFRKCSNWDSFSSLRKYGSEDPDPEFPQIWKSRSTGIHPQAVLKELCQSAFLTRSGISFENMPEKVQIHCPECLAASGGYFDSVRLADSSP